MMAAFIYLEQKLPLFYTSKMSQKQEDHWGGL